MTSKTFSLDTACDLVGNALGELMNPAFPDFMPLFENTFTALLAACQQGRYST